MILMLKIEAQNNRAGKAWRLSILSMTTWIYGDFVIFMLRNFTTVERRPEDG